MGSNKPTERSSDRGLFWRHGAWHSRIADHNGKIIRKKLSADKATARALLGQMRITFEKQKLGILPDVIKKQIKKLVDLHDRYVQHLKAGSRSENTIVSFENAWRQVIQRNKFVYLSDIDMAKIDEWASSKLAEGTRGQTLNTYMTHVIGAFEWTFRNGFINYNPLANWRWLRRNESRPRRDIKPHEVDAILKTERSDEWRLRWMVYLYLGLRNEAGSNLRWEWIDWEARKLHIPVEANKSVRPHDLPIHPRLYDTLKAWRLRGHLEPDGRVFREVTTRSISRRFKAVCIKAGLDAEALTLHSVRHTFATMAFETSGKNIKVVQELLNHVDAATTMKYLHLTEAEKVDTIYRLDYGEAAEQ